MSKEFIVPIPARLKNVAKNGHVAGVEDIYDDELQKTQKEINAERESDITNLDNEVSALQKQDIEVVADHTAVTNPDPKKIYREQGTESYTDYMYQNNAWKELATYAFPGVDEEPTAGSENLVKSGGVDKAIKESEIVDGGVSSEAELSFVDEDDNCIAQFKDGHLKGKNFDTRTLVDDEKLESFGDNFSKVDNLDGNDTISFIDSNDECALQVKDGHLKTKEFDSSKIIGLDNIENNKEALSFVDENENCVLQVKSGNIKTKNFDSSKIKSAKSFAVADINVLTVSGLSTKEGNIISLAPGIENKAYLDGGFECAHWEMFASFICSNGVSFIMGKDNETFGAWIEIKKEGNNNSYTLYNNGIDGEYSRTFTGELGFTLNDNEQYTLHLFFNTTTKKVIGFDLFGQYNEYFTHEFTDVVCNGYGNPALYSDTTCIVKSFSLTNQNYYDIKNAKLAVWGHSYVEGDSLGSDRDKTFTNLLANELGATKVFCFGRGGDTFDGIINKAANEFFLTNNVQYGLVCAGANDKNLSASYIKQRIDTLYQMLINNNISPIFFTIAPIENTISDTFREVNRYIRSKYVYVDMEQVFLSVDAINGNPTDSDIKTNLYLNDSIHPTVQGHELIYHRIKADCPFIF